MQEKIIGLKILKLKEEKRRKKVGVGGNSTELQKPSVEAEVYDNNKKCD